MNSKSDSSFKHLEMILALSVVFSLIASSNRSSFAFSAAQKRSANNKSVSKKLVSKKSVSNKSKPAEEWYLQTEDKASFLHIYEVGDGEPVIVLHGGPGAGHRYLLPVANGLETRFRFIFYDQRGAGLSHCAKEEISLQKNVEDLESLRKALGLAKLNLMSHSAGTMLAMNYLEAYPQKVKNLILLGALDPKNGKRDFFTPEELGLFAKKQEEVRRFAERPEVQAEIEKAGLNKPGLTPRQEFLLRRIRSAAGNIYHIDRWRQDLFFFVNREAAQATQRTTNFVYDWSKMLANHPHAITVINGEYDYVVGLKGSPIWKRVVSTEARNVRLVIIEKAGHNSWIDDPVYFKEAVLAALTRKK